MGPRHLAKPAIAECVVDTFVLAQQVWKLCEFASWVIMPNHVHVLLWPYGPLKRTTRAIKSQSAKLANEILGFTGRPFWQSESYDHWIRNKNEANWVIRYIEANPVKAGLAAKPEDWQWSSGSARFREVLPCVPERI